MAKAMYTFSNFPDDKKAEVEQPIRERKGKEKGTQLISDITDAK